jgi:hypothetical protein
LESTQAEDLLMFDEITKTAHMNSRYRTALFTLLLPAITACSVMSTAKKPAQNNSEVDERMKQAWDVSLERYYHPRTKLFYDYITSYEKGKWLSHLPTADEVSRLYPNEYGYGTGMEDCMISAGVMLDMVADKYAVTGDESLKQIARNIFEGVYLTATAHGTDGFLPRGLTPDDGKSYYIASSRDQYTHAVHGLWVYHQSPLSEGPARKRVAYILTKIADRMKATVIPENDYNSLMADGRPDPRGIQKMWQVKAHEAARLPMIYAAAWVASGDDAYYKDYRQYIAAAVEQSFAIEDQTPTYSLLQMQSCLELLSSIETDLKLKEQMKEIMRNVSERAAQRAIRASVAAESLDFTLLPTDWRTGDGIRTGSESRKVWYNPRESGEAAITQLIAGCKSFEEAQVELLRTAILRIDYKLVASSGIYYLQGAYWKARRYGCL